MDLSARDDRKDLTMLCWVLQALPHLFSIVIFRSTPVACSKYHGPWYPRPWMVRSFPAKLDVSGNMSILYI